MSSTRSLKHKLCTTAVVALLATTATAFAQTTPARPDAGPQTHPHRQERMQKHMGDFKARLKIEPTQEAAWTAWTSAMQPTVEMQTRREKMRSEMKDLTTPERIDRMKAMRAERDATMDKRAQATKDFYAQLSAEQKKTFDASSRRFADGRGNRHGGGHGHHG